MRGLGAMAMVAAMIAGCGGRAATPRAGRDAEVGDDGAARGGRDAEVGDGAEGRVGDGGAGDTSGAGRAAGIALPMPAVLPCARAVKASAGAGGLDGQQLVLLDGGGAVLAEVRAPSGNWRRDDDERGEDVVVELGALRELVYARSDEPRLAWLHLQCRAPEGNEVVPSLSWSCDATACTLAAAILDAPPMPALAPRLGDCQAAAEARRPPGRCRAALTAEVRRLGDELRALLADACDRGACSEDILAVRRATAAIAWPRLRHTGVRSGPLWLTSDEDDPPPPVRRHTFTDGTTTAAFLCSDRGDEERLDVCTLRIDTPAGPILFVREVTSGLLALRHRASMISRTSSTVILSQDAARLATP